MDTIWFGVKIGIGIVIGIALARFLFREFMGFIDARRFTKVGCTFQHEGGSEAHPNGWMTRDPESSDWILWDIDRNKVMRLHDEAAQSTAWRATTESYGDFMRMAKGYNDLLNGMWKNRKQESQG
jgi:hypothetical protein